MSWIGELSEEAGIWLMLKTKRILFDEESEINGRVLVIDAEHFGRTMLIGHRLAFQTSERYDFYDETLGNVALNEHPEPKRVLIIGGGDGKIARIAYAHGAEHVTILEIDPVVIRASRDILRLDGGALERARIIIGDAYEKIDEIEERFDVIIGDYSDPYPDEPAKSLLGEDFIKKLKEHLEPRGVIALQAGSPIFQRRLLEKVYRALSREFRYTKIFRSPMPVYPSGIRSYVIASDREFSGPYREISGEFYNTKIHKALFSLPSLMEE